MGIVRREQQSYTVEQVAAALADTLALAHGAHLTPEDRAALLPSIFDKVAMKEVAYEQLGGVPLGNFPPPPG